MRVDSHASYWLANLDAEVRRCFEEAFKNIKPTDGIIVGMWQQFGVQVAQDAGAVREVCAAG